MLKQQERATALYCRLSRDDEYTSESMSIQTQKTMLSAYAETNGLTPYSFFVDDGYSGTSYDRPDFKRMVADIESGKIGTVIVKDLSRLGREYLQTGYYTEIFFPKFDVRFIAVNDNVDSDNGENEFAPFKNIINEFYAKDISRKVKSAFRTRALNGGVCVGRAPFGYEKAAGTTNRLQPDENAPVVRRMFALALSGTSGKSIANILTKEKVMIPKAYYLTKIGKADAPHFPKFPYKWSKRTVHGILSNPVYTGDLVCLRYKTKSFKDKRQIIRPQDEWVVIPDLHEALVSKQDFETVQQRISVKQMQPKHNPVNIFRGLLYCAECGTRLSFQARNEKFRSKGCYRCEHRIRYGKDACSPHYITIEQIEQIVLNDIQRHVRFANDDTDKYAKHLLELSKQDSSEMSTRKRNVTKSTKRLAELDKLLQKLYEDKVFGIISDERYAKMSNSMEDEAAGLKKKIAEDTAYINGNAEKSKGIDDFVKLISGYETITELDEELVHTLIDKIVVHEREKTETGYTMKVEIYYRFIGNIGGESLDVPDLKVKAA